MPAAENKVPDSTPPLEISELDLPPMAAMPAPTDVMVALSPLKPDELALRQPPAAAAVGGAALRAGPVGGSFSVLGRAASSSAAAAGAAASSLGSAAADTQLIRGIDSPGLGLMPLPAAAAAAVSAGVPSAAPAASAAASAAAPAPMSLDGDTESDSDETARVPASLALHRLQPAALAAPAAAASAASAGSAASSPPAAILSMSLVPVRRTVICYEHVLLNWILLLAQMDAISAAERRVR